MFRFKCTKVKNLPNRSSMKVFLETQLHTKNPSRSQYDDTRVFTCLAESCRCEVFSFWWEAARWCLCVMASSGDAAVVPFTDQHSYLCSISRLSSSYKHPQPMALWCFYHCVYSEKSGKYVNFRTKRAGINNGLRAWLLDMVGTNVLSPMRLKRALC